jgi:hypothetical protein
MELTITDDDLTLTISGTRRMTIEVLSRALGFTVQWDSLSPTDVADESNDHQCDQCQRYRDANVSPWRNSDGVTLCLDCALGKVKWRAQRLDGRITIHRDGCGHDPNPTETINAGYDRSANGYASYLRHMGLDQVIEHADCC